MTPLRRQSRIPPGSWNLTRYPGVVLKDRLQTHFLQIWWTPLGTRYLTLTRSITLPLDHVSKYLEARVRCPLSREARNKLRAECPRPIIPNKVCDTPSVDPKMIQFLSKAGWNPRKGLESALRSCQDKLLDVFGPLAKIFDLAESAKAEGGQVDPVELREWVQRAICITGNVNTSLSMERRKAILFKIEPKLANLALTETGKEAQGLLFGESFIKDLGRYVGAFTALDKAQSSMKRVFHEQNRVLVDSELSDLVRKGAVEPAPGPPYGVISNIFLVAKKGGQMRPVINLRALNAFVVYRHFKMEGIHLLRDLLQMGDWMVKLDLKDAYLMVPVEDASRNLLCFSWQGSVWRFTCLPFGLSSAPWCFTKLMRPAMAWLRSRGVRLIIYLDDILIMAQDCSVLLDHLRWTMDLLSELGFLLNREKSCLSPSREMEFLRFMVDSTAGTLSLPSAKIRSIRKELLRARSSPHIPLRQLARIIGLLASSIQAVFPAPLHYRALQRLKIAHLRKGASYADWIPLDEETREELSWWIHNLHAWNGKAIFGQRPDSVVDSDASLSGWGAHCEGITTGGGWSEIETGFHINALELLAGSFAIKSFTRDTARSCIQLRMDNVSAVRYINGMGGTRSTILSRLAKDFWDYCLSKELVVLAEYLPGVHNIHADWSSRHLSDSSDWQLDPEHATGTILQLAPGSGSRGRGCIPPRLVQRDPLCVPAVPTDSADPHSSAPVCRGTDLAGPVLELPIMVPPPSGDDGRDPSPSPDVADSPPRPSPPATSSSPGRDTAPAGVSDFRGPWEVPGVSGTAKVLLENAWAPGTRRSYRSAWGFWADWCLARDLDPISAPVTEILHFLSSLFDQGKAYRTISLFRSAISASHQGFDGTPAGQHPLVCRLMRGSRMSRPPRPRFTTTWDVSRVLSFLSAWPQNSELSLRQLSAKLVTLLCLISCKRVSDVRALDHDARSYGRGHV
ncbi:uncharacterized protein LOC120977528 [Bufo bufo]|uniref:uncharacterized protein LOC120977528 n=1 Tax=Bufo bufo TaxID=8384 RepID=UPI001ABDE592|nr:uncharacterized protein LOC120977528 [Bufo bufo]